MIRLWIAEHRLLVRALALAILAVAGTSTWVVIALQTGAPIDTSGSGFDIDEPYGSAPARVGNPVDVDLVAAPSLLELRPGVATEVWSYNDSVPGPEIRLEHGDRVRVNFRNDLAEATSIHWHGIRVPNAMDGVPELNQAPVPPGGSFLYEFTPPDAGTYWYHSHVNGSEQLERGLYGAIVVESSSTTIERDLTWIVDDWLLDDAGQIVDTFNAASEITHNGRWGNSVTVNSVTNPQVSVRPGERIRLRLINASNARVYAPRFGPLDARLVAVDGGSVRDPSEADGFVLGPGNRIDVDVTVPANATGRLPVVDDFTGEIFELATLVAEGEAVMPAEVGAADGEAVPVLSLPGDLEPDHEFVFDIVSPPDQRPRWTINARSYPDADTYRTTRGDLSILRLRNASQVLHPIHIHGQFFTVRARNGEPVDEGTFRDTILLEPGDVIDVAMVATDIGTWLIHCHIQEHAEAGMAALLDVVP